MSEQQTTPPPIQSLPLTRDEFSEIPVTERPIDHPALGDRIPFTLRSGMPAMIFTHYSASKVSQKDKWLPSWP
ncbi:hypothetical protein P691DRAFT_271009 [Macrolepiota fuliginosa MF-IS2]|uniref:Uncharacterized protein n=1 Tax=Macrolepiota fuliginosa MF-IS2 TaxID=1400762 RepID=A0A9P6BYQ4_9AGAR|nr:hypothetical protein P691DRAFT_271009 [Macrolepiota fuliginosa MF-IS2]